MQKRIIKWNGVGEGGSPAPLLLANLGQHEFLFLPRADVLTIPLHQRQRVFTSAFRTAVFTDLSPTGKPFIFLWNRCEKKVWVRPYAACTLVAVSVSQVYSMRETVSGPSLVSSGRALWGPWGRACEWVNSPTSVISEDPRLYHQGIESIH